MTGFTETAYNVFAPTDAGGNPRRVDNADTQRWGTEVERLIMALIAGAGGDIDLPNLLIRYTVTGGTANAITATPNLPVPSGPGIALFSIRILQPNTGPVTVNGKPLRTNTGREISANGLVAGGNYLFLDNGSEYRLLSDEVSTAIVAAAERARDQAEAIAARIDLGALDQAVAESDASARAAENNADRAEAARDAAFVKADVYPDVTSGLAGTASGQQFQVVSPDGLEMIRYRNNSGAAVEVARYPSAEAVAPLKRGPVNRFAVKDERGFEIITYSNEDGFGIPGGSFRKSDHGTLRLVDRRGFAIDVASSNDESSAGTAVRIWAGALTDTSFAVCCDIEGDGPARLIVATDNLLQNQIYRSEAKVPMQTPGENGAIWQPVRFDVVGLNPNTTYYYAVEVAGVLAPDATRSVKTMPFSGEPAAFSFVFGSCTDFRLTATAPSLDAIRQEPGLLFWMHMGDLAYTDINVADIRLHRSRITRLRYRNLETPEKVNRTLPIVYVPDDHDSSDNDGHWDKVHASGAHDHTIIEHMLQAYYETVPHYPLVPEAEKKALSQTFTVGKVRFVVMDTRSQRRYEVGTPTILGNGSNPPQSWDQYSWVCEQLIRARDDGMNLIFLVSPASWNNTVHAGWEHHYSNERTALSDFIRDTPGLPQVVLLTADSHISAADDGTMTDGSTGGGLTMPQFMSSPYRALPLGVASPFYWLGEHAEFTGDHQYTRVDVAADGNFTVSIKGEPYANGVATTRKVLSSLDATPAVQFSAANYNAPASSPTTVTVTKSFFGPANGCSVQWSSSNGQSGVAVFGPNNGKTEIKVNAPASGSITVTLADPVGCVLGAQTTATITAT